MKYLKHLHMFDNRHLALIREMIFERLTWDEEVEEDRNLLIHIEDIISVREPFDRILIKEAVTLKRMVDPIVEKILNGRLGKEDLLHNDPTSGWEFSGGIIGAMIAEQLGAAIALAMADMEIAKKTLSCIVNTLERAKAPTCWFVLTIRCMSRDHQISFTKFRDIPEFKDIAKNYREPLRATV